MFAVEVNSGTGISEHLLLQKFGSTKITDRQSAAADTVHSMTTKAKAPPWGKRGFQCGLVRLGGTSNVCLTPPQKGSKSRRPDK